MAASSSASCAGLRGEMFNLAIRPVGAPDDSDSDDDAEMVALKARLAERGLHVFLCDEAPGVNLKRTIFGAFSAADLAIIAASATYGRQTTSGFSTYEEMNFLQVKKKPGRGVFVEAHPDAIRVVRDAYPDAVFLAARVLFQPIF